jgi:sortase (surface protein transpeptidase)
MKKFLLYVLLAMIVVGSVLYYNANHPGNGSGVTAAGWPPQTLSIPAINVNASVLAVGKNAQGQMDAPVSQAYNSTYWTSVFWYSPGTVPGQQGNAVIAGHVDRVGGDPAVFWTLYKLVPGNDVYITPTQGKTLHFVVDRVVSYSATAPAADVINAVFGTSSGIHLNLITCSGVWTGHGYDQRLVVFTTLT